MIISRTPYRISLFGGSTDYKEYYQEHGSLLIGLCIDKYSYLSGRNTPSVIPYKSRFSYSKNEIINHCKDSEYLDKISHNGIRGVLEYLNHFDPIEISHFCDIPSQTGLGSSSSFIVGLLNLIHFLRREKVSKSFLAKEAIEIERFLLKEAGGIQDQIWAAYGGFNSIEIDTTGEFRVKPLPISENFINEFLSCTCLIYTGDQRNSFELANHAKSTHSIKSNIHSLAVEAYSLFKDENLFGIGDLLNESWKFKKSLNDNISNTKIDDLYDHLLSEGMIGGKLLGAGGSGFMFCIFPNAESYQFNSDFQNRLIDFNIDFTGSKIIYQ